MIGIASALIARPARRAFHRRIEGREQEARHLRFSAARPHGNSRRRRNNREIYAVSAFSIRNQPRWLASAPFSHRKALDPTKTVKKVTALH